ncbi:MAG TPA: aldehyde dehydrogenase [Candidatus Polarisedimenticolia bacterium]|jgi:aminomuconate-semialdehyde/2-hydroxymuconate-6-semialdehyde dehydrogenase|nr:aldehyde dehydrogenase [Candidatus Polarisedimenticolia bacterium]
MPVIANYIDGALVEPASGRYLDNLEPATGAAYSSVGDGDERDVERAVEAARRAFPAWSGLPAEERARLLLAIAARIESRLEDLARAESIDTGKPLALARALDIPRAARNFRFFATAALHDHSESHATDRKAINYTLRRPRGVAGLISPWNLPLYLLTWKVAPALAVGNTAVAKPSELTPMTAHMLAEIARDAGLPPGVLNIVHGRGASVGAAIARHPEILTLSFTGSTATGADIARNAAPLFKKVALEMGGKNPNIIFADADHDEAVAAALKAAFTNQGEICLSGSRLFVEQEAYRSFVEDFTGRASRLRLGDPLDPDTEQGALISAAHRDKVLGYIEQARRDGGRILCGGGPPRTAVSERCRGGFFVEPTVITDLPVASSVNREEIFGPVVTITPFRSEDEVVAWANGTDYGLAASVWTESLPRAHRLAERIASGTVWINCWMLRDLRVPFGGMKRSGLGREGGEEALRFFTEPKNVCIQFPHDASGD